MNYLAHLRLAPADPLLRLGNLLGDFARGVDVAALPAPLRHGIAMHRAIDRFTDAHPAFRRSRARIAPPFTRFSAVLVDVFYDHFLARDWDTWGDGRTLGAFTNEIYDQLDGHRHLLPPRLAAAAPHMRRLDWLGGYATLAGIDATLARLGMRLRRPSPLGSAGGELRAHGAGLAADFAAFFPAVLAFANGFARAGTVTCGTAARPSP